MRPRPWSGRPVSWVPAFALSQLIATNNLIFRIEITAHCYKKAQEETKLMQEQIENELGLSPADKDVVVLYDGEKGNQVWISLVASDNFQYWINSFFSQSSDFWNGKRIVEMNKPRPLWFSKNLLQKTTQKAATTKEVKPSDLGWFGIRAGRRLSKIICIF